MNQTGCGCALVLIAAGGLATWCAHRYAPEHLRAVGTGSAAVVVGLLALMALAHWLRRRSILGKSLRRIDRMTGEEFEDYVADLLEIHGWWVEHVGGSGDFGIDLIAGRRGIAIGIQAKRYEGRVPNSAVQEARAGADYHDCEHAAVVTQSEFTHAARRQAARMKPPVVLIDREELKSVGGLLQTPPETVNSC